MLCCSATAVAVQVPFGLSCKTHDASSADTWQSIASKHKVLVNELIRSNPQMDGRVTRNSALFIPPCINGVVQGTKREGASTAFATAVDQKHPLKQAAAAAQRASCCRRWTICMRECVQLCCMFCCFAESDRVISAAT